MDIIRKYFSPITKKIAKRDKDELDHAEFILIVKSNSKILINSIKKRLGIHSFEDQDGNFNVIKIPERRIRSIQVELDRRRKY